MKLLQNLETSRLLLRQPVTEDAALIFEHYAQDQEVSKYMTWRPHKSICETDEYVDRCISSWADHSAFSYVVEQKENAQLIGMIEIRLNQFKADLGYVLTKSEWGKGYTPEALQALINWVLGEDEIYRIWAVCDVENAASARVMEKVGMQREGILRQWLVHPNISKEPRDCYCYAICK
ncbi:MAG: GNAT family N-acetyltransferase [Pleurocapsa sp. SU_5_0]|nr:GNAT family N-acetyltransferase [Pleurocapsa sp. SU_5_0]NJR47869.1 GNAT family N-acetyltransferase [Hyellaceae cyanobacterium CSU_1_1]